MELELFEKVYYNHLLTRDGYIKISKAHTRVEFEQGAMLLKAGKVSKEFWVIEKGLFRSFLYDYNGNEVTTEFYYDNEILIESFSLFQRTPSKENFQAVTDGIAWKIEYDVFKDLLNQITGFNEWGRVWATSQLFIQKQRSIDVVTLNATDRYLKLINEQPYIIQHSPLKYIASYLGVTDTSLSRIRKDISNG